MNFFDELRGIKTREQIREAAKKSGEPYIDFEKKKSNGARKIYESMLEILYNKFHNRSEAWDKLMEFLVVDNCPPVLLQIENKLKWLVEDKLLASSLLNVYNEQTLKVLKEEEEDCLGELYIIHNGKISGQVLTPMHLTDFICRMTVGEQVKRKDGPINILDPCVGSGRFLFSAHKLAPDANLFGVDVDLRILRVAFVNCAIRGIKAYLLHANSLGHEINIGIEDGIYNWQFANRLWENHWDELKTVKLQKQESLF